MNKNTELTCTENDNLSLEHNEIFIKDEHENLDSDNENDWMNEGIKTEELDPPDMELSIIDEIEDEANRQLAENEEIPLLIKTEEVFALPSASIENQMKITSVNHQSSSKRMIKDILKGENETEGDGTINVKKKKKKSNIIGMFECEYCHFMTKYKENLKKHVDSIHLKIKQFKCKDCSFETYTYYSLQSHINNIHLHIKIYNCDFCYFKTNSNNTLMQHTSSVHVRDHCLKCKYCNYYTTDKNELTDHFQSDCQEAQLRKPSTDSPSNAYPLSIYTSSDVPNGNTQKNVEENCTSEDKESKEPKKKKCELCNQSFHTKKNLKSHIESVHFKIQIYECEHCEYKNYRKQLLDDHVKAVHLKFKNEKFNFCLVCNKEFDNSEDLKMHTETYHGKFPCTHCDFKSSSWRRLDNHIKGKHLNLRKFKCYFCDSTFVTEAGLKTHITVVHSD